MARASSSSSSASVGATHERLSRAIQSYKTDWTLKNGALPTNQTYDLTFIRKSNKLPVENGDLEIFFQDFFLISNQPNATRVIIILGLDGLTTSPETFLHIFKNNIPQTHCYIREVRPRPNLIHFTKIDLGEVVALLTGDPFDNAHPITVEFLTLFEKLYANKESNSKIATERTAIVHHRNSIRSTLKPSPTVTMTMRSESPST